MRTIKLDLNKMTSLPALHNYLHKALELPEYYGMNLDALHDCLTELAVPTELVISAQVKDEKYLGFVFFRSVLQNFKQLRAIPA